MLEYVDDLLGQRQVGACGAGMRVGPASFGVRLRAARARPIRMPSVKARTATSSPTVHATQLTLKCYG